MFSKLMITHVLRDRTQLFLFLPKCLIGSSVTFFVGILFPCKLKQAFIHFRNCIFFKKLKMLVRLALQNILFFYDNYFTNLVFKSGS